MSDTPKITDPVVLRRMADVVRAEVQRQAEAEAEAEAERKEADSSAEEQR